MKKISEKRKAAGKLIRYARLSAGYSQEEFAELCGVCKTCVNRWESYHFVPNAEHRAAIVAAVKFAGYSDDKQKLRFEFANDLNMACASFGETYKRRAGCEQQ